MARGGEPHDGRPRRPRAAPLPWVPAFAGTTVGGRPFWVAGLAGMARAGGCRGGDGGWWGVFARAGRVFGLLDEAAELDGAGYSCDSYVVGCLSEG